MRTYQRLHAPYELSSPLAAVRHAGMFLLQTLARWREQHRLYMELSQLDGRELADLGLQPQDIDALVHGRSVPALEARARRH